MVRFEVDVEARYSSFFEEVLKIFKFCDYKKHNYPPIHNKEITAKFTKQVEKLLYLEEVKEAIELIEEKRNKLNK